MKSVVIFQLSDGRRFDTVEEARKTVDNEIGNKACKIAHASLKPQYEKYTPRLEWILSDEFETLCREYIRALDLIKEINDGPTEDDED